MQSKIRYPWTELFESSLATIPIFAYGSLVDPQSAAKSFQFTQIEMNYVVAIGVRRIFNYVMPERHLRRWGVDPTGNEKAALNLQVTEKAQDKVNGAIIQIDKRDFENMLLREEGYDLIQLECCKWSNDSENRGGANCLKPFAFIADPETSLGASFVDNRVEPVPGYQDLCIEAAHNVSTGFGRYFNRTTFLNSGMTVEEAKQNIKATNDN